MEKLPLSSVGQCWRDHCCGALPAEMFCNSIQGTGFISVKTCPYQPLFCLSSETRRAGSSNRAVSSLRCCSLKRSTRGLFLLEIWRYKWSLTNVYGTGVSSVLFVGRFKCSLLWTLAKRFFWGLKWCLPAPLEILNSGSYKEIWLLFKLWSSSPGIAKKGKRK